MTKDWENDDRTPTGEDDIRDLIDSAETVPDPLEGLVERAKEDPGAPYDPDVVDALANLRKNDLAEFERLRHLLKKNTHIRVTSLDEAIDFRMDSQGGTGRDSQSNRLVEIAQIAKLFHSPDGIAYAAIELDGHIEVMQVRESAFKRWLAHELYQETEGAAGSEAYAAALNTIEAQALFVGEKHPVYLRVAREGDTIWIDHADEKWRVTEIRPEGWTVLERSPVCFRRTTGMRPLPLPEHGGNIEEIKTFLNITHDDEMVLVMAIVLAALGGIHPYPPYVITGEQGSAKSSFTEILKHLLDPNVSPVRSLPRNEHELAIAADNMYLLAFDNVSTLPAWLSDAICRLSTGAGVFARKLYTDREASLFYATRPVMLNGIENMVRRQDLADRSVFLRLKRIPDEARRTKAQLMKRIRKCLTTNSRCPF